MAEARRTTRILFVLLAASLALAHDLQGQDPLQWGGFAVVRGTSHASTLFE